MRSLFVNWLVGSFLFAAVAQSRAESTFAGTLVLPTTSGLTPIGGAVRFVVNAGEVSFQSTLFLWASATTFEPVLLIQNKVIPFDFGTGTLGSTLVGTCLSYSFAVGAGFAWTSAGLFGPARPHSSSGQLFADGIPFADMIMFEAGSSQVIRFGGVTLSDDAIDQLKRGKLYVSFRSAQYPDGEIRGQILPVPDNQHRHNGTHSSSK